MELLRSIVAGTITAGTAETMPGASSSDWSFLPDSFAADHDSLRFSFGGVTCTGAGVISVAHETQAPGGTRVTRVLATQAFADGDTEVDAIEVPQVPKVGRYTVFISTVAATTGDFVGEVYFEGYRSPVLAS